MNTRGFLFYKALCSHFIFVPVLVFRSALGLLLREPMHIKATQTVSQTDRQADDNG